MNEIEDAAPDLPPSKSSRKRDAHAAQKMGQHLVGMRQEEVAGLPLSDALHAAIVEARRLRGHGALGRQYQYIGKLMRDVDMAELEAALAAQSDAQKARARLKR